MTSQDRWLLPVGVDELLPERAIVAEQVRRDVLDLFKSWGYQYVMPPLIEFTDSLLIGLGEDIAHQSFRLTDQISGKPLAVRADITSQTARIDAHSMKASGINRLCYAGSVLHAMPKTLAASRCPIQAGAEIYGDASVSADIEVISLMLDTLQQIDVNYAAASNDGKKSLHHLTLDLGHVSVFRVIADEIKSHSNGISQAGLDQIFDAVQRKSVPDLKIIVPQFITDTDLADLLYALPSLCGSTAILQRARELLSGFGAVVENALNDIEKISDTINQRFPDVTIYLDLAELRGYDYHTGLVFAAYADSYGAALANGGRYDDVGKVFGAARPATGFNTDVKSLIDFVYGDAAVNNALQVNKEKIIAAPDINDVDLWLAIKALRSKGDTVIRVAEGDMKNYSRKLVLTGKNWLIG